MPKNTEFEKTDPTRRANAALMLLIICTGIGGGMAPLVYTGIMDGNVPFWAQIILVLAICVPILGIIASGLGLALSISAGHQPDVRRSAP